MPNRRIAQARGRETILECRITAYPHAVNYWEKDQQYLVIIIIIIIIIIIVIVITGGCWLLGEGRTARDEFRAPSH